jgi:hypothetical protein
MLPSMWDCRPDLTMELATRIGVDLVGVEK